MSHRGGGGGGGDAELESLLIPVLIVTKCVVVECL